MTTLTLKGFAAVTRRHVRKANNGRCNMAVVVRKHKPFTYRLEARKFAPAAGN